VKLRDRAYESFRQHLLALDLRPGQFISQRELVQLTGLTLGAIREMIPRLEADGLIVTVPKRGMRIAALDPRLIRNAFELRRILECEAVAVFTRNAPESSVEALLQAHQQVLLPAEAGDRSRELLDRAQTTDWAMHEALIDALDNELIRNIYRVNSLKVRLIRLEQSLLSAEVLMTALYEHSRILDAITARNAEAAVAALRAHIESAYLRALGVGPAADLRPATSATV
jgi:DNA-binding GntR family transcriptional regulator